MIRGEEHLSTTPKYLLLRHALGYGDDPVFAHLPLLVNEKRQKLSKRRDKVAAAAVPRRGLPGRGDAQLPRAARLVAARGRGDPADRGDDRRSSASRTSRARPRSSTSRSSGTSTREYIRALPPDGVRRAARASGSRVEGFDARSRRAARADARRAARRAAGDGRLPVRRRVEPDEASWQKAIAKNEWSADVLRDALADYRDVRVGGRAAEGRDAGDRRAARPEARQGAGADPRRGDRADGRAAALRVARGARPRRDAGAHRADAGARG